ncbi:hypothetical protein OC842_001614 [Tilletia horrida]|uniref:Uncharacterized protein n=1 Tax=Tilletia horrida TaxID=155126 RepID=A0AAN6GEP5_9BASI|nr:hypothetical protein OC842_001614 [Tilletia horrida]
MPSQPDIEDYASKIRPELLGPFFAALHAVQESHVGLTRPDWAAIWTQARFSDTPDTLKQWLAYFWDSYLDDVKAGTTPPLFEAPISQAPSGDAGNHRLPAPEQRQKQQQQQDNEGASAQDHEEQTESQLNSRPSSPSVYLRDWKLDRDHAQGGSHGGVFRTGAASHVEHPTGEGQPEAAISDMRSSSHQLVLRQTRQALEEYEPIGAVSEEARRSLRGSHTKLMSSWEYVGLYRLSQGVPTGLAMTESEVANFVSSKPRKVRLPTHCKRVRECWRCRHCGTHRYIKISGCYVLSKHVKKHHAHVTP